MLVDRSQSRMIPLKIVKHPMQVLPRGRIHRPRHKQLSLGRLLVINLSKFHFHLQTLLLHQQNIKKNPLHLKVRHPLAKHAHRNQVHLQKHQQKLLLNHQQHLDLACQSHLIQIQNKQQQQNKNKNQQNSNRLQKAEKDIFKLTNRYDGINCDTSIWGDAMDTSPPERGRSRSRSSSSLSSNGDDSCSPSRSRNNREQIRQHKGTISPIRPPK